MRGLAYRGMAIDHLERGIATETLGGDRTQEQAQEALALALHFLVRVLQGEVAGLVHVPEPCL